MLCSIFVFEGQLPFSHKLEASTDPSIRIELVAHVRFVDGG